MKKLILLILLFSTSVISQQKVLNLDECLKIGMQNSKELKISRSKVIGAESRESEAGSYMLPKITFGANYTRLSNVDPFQVSVPFSPAPIQIQETILNNFGFNLALQQPIFTGFKLLSLKKAAGYSYTAQEFEYSSMANETAFNIHQAYWNFYKAQQVVSVVQENLKSLQKHLDDTKRLLENGLVTKNDLLKIQVQEANVELKKINAENILSLARINLNKAMGIELNFETIIDIEKKPVDINNFDYSNLLAEAMKSRPELKSFENKIKAGEHNLTAANSGWFPSLFLFSHLYYNKPNQRVLPLENKFNNTWDIGVALNWDLWDWGGTSAKSDQAEQQLVQAQTAFEILKENIEIEVYRNYLKLISEFEKLNVSEKGLESASENYRITNEKYLQQLATSSELIDAEVELLNAQTQLVVSSADLELAKVELEKSAGRILY